MSDVRILAEAKDFHGRTAMQYGLPEIREALRERLLFLSRYQLQKGPPIYKSSTCLVIKAYDEMAMEQYTSYFEKFSNENKTLSEKGLGKVFDSLGRQASRNHLSIMFTVHDIDKSNALSEYEYIKMWRDEFDGDMRREVAFKFMSDKGQFEREVKLRD
eukprot:1248652-Ditylum_brightwellii.AAC.1